MSEHLTAEDLQQFRRGNLPPQRVIAVSRHLAACATCAARARESAGADGADSLRLSLAGRPKHPTAEELMGYVDGQSMEEVEEHLRLCAACRAEVDDLVHFRRRIAPSRRWIVAASVAAAIVMGVTALLLRPWPARPAPSMPSRPDRWAAIVAEALVARRLAPPPFLGEIRGGTDQVRGASPSAINAALQPAGMVVATDRPRFRWQGNGRHAVVSVFDGARRIARSGLLDMDEWTPDEALPRGRTYQWQVELRNHTTRVLPAPPDPPAAFHVMDEQSWRDLTAAQRERPGDHLLLGVLYARAGAQQEAARELAAYRATHRDDMAARQLEESVREW